MIGIDIVNIEKLKNKLEKNNFDSKIFTDNEIHYSRKKENSIQTFAGIFAAKEAIIKAFNLNLAYILRKKIEIRHINNKPEIYINCKKSKASLSISHNGNYAVAVCIKNDEIFKIDKDIKKLIKKRPESGHKGDFGKVAVIGGQKGMAGSVYMSSLASLRSGAGLSYIICPSSISNILQIKSTESIIEEVDCDYFYNEINIVDKILDLSKGKDAIAIGPGMGKGKDLNQLVKAILDNYHNKIVIDADGLNSLKNDIHIINGKENIVLTPHEMEFSRISRLPLSYIKNNREKVSIEFAKKHKIILVLKGKNTIVTDGNRLYINSSGNSGMATAGSGDVLTGILLSNLCLMDTFEAAVFSVYMHGLAGDIYAKDNCEDSLIASDIIENLPKAYRLMRC
ncbi:NAD(P)H-hydrate dehydratase [Anaerococcus hydrogenalis]|uniref:NAD(P)H-hydrate dehydratase n=1 Tax=Anaerococcus hydrogenalis TaxID=33029 RepID=UPI0023EFA4A0|nr:NAD(P)H-hydrate dehydratase [Anaerococcus hydrogenalis]